MHAALRLWAVLNGVEPLCALCGFCSTGHCCRGIRRHSQMTQLIRVCSHHGGSYHQGIYCRLISHNEFIDWFEKVNSPTKSSTYCSLLLIRILSGRFCGGVGFSKPISQYIVSDKGGSTRSRAERALWATFGEKCAGLEPHH